MSILGVVARNGRPTLRPEEQEVADVLRRVFPGALVGQHDDGSEASQYDLELSASLSGAVEVGRVTDAEIWRAQAHWHRALQAHSTPELKWSWTFILSEISDAASRLRFPLLARPDQTELTAVLARLEARGIMRVGRMWDHVAVERAGWWIDDSDMADLFGLLGRTAEHGSAVDLSRHGEIGGWSFAFAFGDTSSSEPDRFAAEVEDLLHAAERADMVAKLGHSGLPVRLAALVCDSTTGVGWSTSHLPADTTPSVSIELPPAITRVLVVGMNGLTILYSQEGGWSRHDVPTQDPPASVGR